MALALIPKFWKMQNYLRNLFEKCKCPGSVSKMAEKLV